MNNYDGLIKVEAGIATREPIPDFLWGMPNYIFLDLSWTDKQFRVQEAVWWPSEVIDPPLPLFMKYGDEVLTPDSQRQVVTVSHPLVPMTPEERVLITSQLSRRMAQVIQRHLDETVQQHEYDGILSLCSYGGSLDPVFSVQARAGLDWRDACWNMAEQLREQVKAEAIPLPTDAELIAMLPPLVWP